MLPDPLQQDHSHPRAERQSEIPRTARERDALVLGEPNVDHAFAGLRFAHCGNSKSNTPRCQALLGIILGIICASFGENALQVLLAPRFKDLPPMPDTGVCVCEEDAEKRGADVEHDRAASEHSGKEQFHKR